MSKHCLNCSNEFTSARNDAKFCSNVCRAQYSNRQKREGKESPGVNVAPLQTDQPKAIISSPDMYGLLGISPKEMFQSSRSEVERLRYENTALKDMVRDYQTKEAIRIETEKIRSEFAPKAEEGLSGLGWVEKITQNEKLMEIALPLLGNIVDKFSNKASDSSGEFEGIEPSKKEKLQALVYMLRDMPEGIVEAFLNIAGNAAQDPSGFLTSLNGTEDAIIENETKTHQHFIP